MRGHLAAALDPLGRPRPAVPELEPSHYGLTEADLDRRFSTHQVHGAANDLTLREILARLRETYCRSIGVQFMHILDMNVQTWLAERMESSLNRASINRLEQLRIYTRLTDAVIFEDFIAKKFVGAKSFSLEGAESLIPLLDLLIETAGSHKVEEIVLGMAHRGRLNVLANIMGKSPRDIFQEFDDTDAGRYLGRGDVKYHLGYSTDWKTQAGKRVHLSLCFNPSHLEYVNTVVLGRVRAKQDRAGDLDRRRGLAVLIHGDAAFAGEGIVQETLNLSQLPAYRIGGTVHVVVNNQIGFTTPPEEGRSTVYATEVARMLQIPIFHVNGEDPEAVAQVVRLAMDFRREFQRDVVLDMYCYRRRGHNESDEPAFTQPVMCSAIDTRPSVREGYREHLLKLGEVTLEEAEAIAERRRKHLEDELQVARGGLYRKETAKMTGLWVKYDGGPELDVPDEDTGVPKDKLAALLEKICALPEGFQPHPKLARLLDQRRAMARGEKPLDWATAELLAFASLAVEGHRVRLTGQDSGRGTFSQRHALYYDTRTCDVHAPLQHLAGIQAPVEIANSPLSEAGVLGYEYGYSLDTPDGLTLWEAQFGDFVNCAQVIIDQFLVSAEDKWKRLSAIALLLPHGFEGQGPEHSSARPERFLALAAEDNIQVVVPTTPAQHFHALRRQVKRSWRKPLIVMTPKSLLRHPKAVSPLDDLASGRFRRILPGAEKKTSVVVACCGKLFYELEAARKRDDISLVRFEQLYPLSDAELDAALPKDVPVTWAQDEPRNMGAWPYLRLRFGDSLLGRPLRVVSRPESASPATGSHASHALEQKKLVEQALSAT